MVQLPALTLLGSMRRPKRVISRRPFQPEEDVRLIQILTTKPFFSWESVAQQFTDRTARQCRERWLNYLCPTVRTGPWTDDEDQLLIALLNEHGRSWSVIRGLFNGRSENDIKNRWYSHLQFDAVQEGGRLTFTATPPERRRRRHTVPDPKWNAFQLLEQQRMAHKSSQICVEERWDCKEDSDVFAEDIDDGWNYDDPRL
jgi:myb proto-oncogene protein